MTQEIAIDNCSHLKSDCCNLSDCLKITLRTVILAGGGAFIVNPTGTGLSSAMITRSKMAHHKLV